MLRADPPSSDGGFFYGQMRGTLWHAHPPPDPHLIDHEDGGALWAGFRVETIIRNYVAIPHTLRVHGVVPVIQSTLYASPLERLGREKNKRVAALNEQLGLLCLAGGVPFLGLNTLLARDGEREERVTPPERKVHADKAGSPDSWWCVVESP